MRSLQWYTFADASVPEKALAFLHDHVGGFGAVTYPSAAWEAIQGASATTAGVSALISHAVVEAATNRRAAQAAGDDATVSMMTQRLLGLSQLRSAWLGQQASADIDAIIAAADAESRNPLAGLGDTFKWLAIAGAVVLALPLLMRATGPRRY